MSKASRGRRVPAKGRAARGVRPAGDFDAIDGIDSSDAPNASDTPAQAAARRTRAQNRAAKRAASGVRPKAVRGGPVRGRSSSNTGLILLAIAAVVVGVGVFALGNPFGSPGASPTPSAAASGSPYGDGTCPTSQPPALGTSEVKYVSIETEKGTMVLKIDGSLSPIAAGNFVALAECGYYNGIGFHRTPLLTSGTPFVIQGGDPAGDGTGGPGYTIEDEEVTADYVRGTVAMARTSQPNSQGSQFFIVLSDEAGEILKSANTYAIFGTVVQGMEVADAIFAASNGVELPADPVVMTKVTVSDTEPAPAPTTAPSAGPTTAPSDAPSEAPTPAPSGG